MAEQFDPRRATPGTTFTFVDVEGKEHNFSSDDEGVVRPKNAAEQNHADSLGLPVARSAKAAEVAEKESK